MKNNAYRLKMATPAGFEPATTGLEVKCSLSNKQLKLNEYLARVF